MLTVYLIFEFSIVTSLFSHYPIPYDLLISCGVFLNVYIYRVFGVDFIY